MEYTTSTKLAKLSSRNGGGFGGPLRTMKEMAEEFGVPHAALAALFRHHNGPHPVLKHHSKNSGKATWLEPQETRKWWKELQAKKQGA